MLKGSENYDATKKKWLHAELELKRHKELLVKSDIAQVALEVKLKQCRNQEQTSVWTSNDETADDPETTVELDTIAEMEMTTTTVPRLTGLHSHFETLLPV
ncbi:unnamed protein product [Coregonus sp. 'balchen']|nr:unnamed protein product [Coregonus sp. 'balchen']